MMNFNSSTKPSDDFHSYFSSEEEEEGSGEVKRLLSSELNQTRTEFSVTADSVVVQDRESETESLKKNPVRKRSKRVRKSGFNNGSSFFEVKKSKLGNSKNDKLSSLSSISDTSSEEYVAYCLIMLSRDEWKKEEVDNYSEDSDVAKVKNTKVKGKYKCETCNKLFRSYQALGGHKTSHHKMKAITAVVRPGRKNAGVVEEKVHECPFCERVFASGQALGGHKRTHFIGAGVILANDGNKGPAKSISRIKGEVLDIDLNLPASCDDDDGISQIEICELL